MSAWRDSAACRPFPELFFTRSERVEALHICRYHCPVAMACHAESRNLHNVQVVIGGRAYGVNGETLTKTEAERGVMAHNDYCRAIEHAREKQHKERIE